MNASGQPGPRIAMEAFAYTDVRLQTGLHKQRFDANRQYLASLSDDALLIPFRFEALLPTPGTPFGGWEVPLSRVRSHFFGHYLSACARTVASSDDDEIRAKANHLVAELARCQQANGNGYVGGIPERYLERVEQYGPNAYVWCPYYMIHKTLMGCYEMYKYAGNQQALDILIAMVAYIKRRIDRLDDAQMARMLTEEHGGMSHVLYQLYRETGDPAHLALAQRWDHRAFLEPLARNVDELTWVHANTSLPKVYGAAEAYEVTGEQWYQEAALNFWSMIHPARMYATGGSNSEELWSEPGKLRKTLVVHGSEHEPFAGWRPANHNQETCTTFNWMWLNQYLYRWTGEARYADQYERNLYNGLLAAQEPDSGMFTYWMPMAPGTRKVFGQPTESFWCCYGTGVQALADLTAGIYYHSPDHQTLAINQFVPSQLHWRRNAGETVTVEQDTAFPAKPETRITIKLTSLQFFELAIRIPWWAQNDARLYLNHELQCIPLPPASYCRLERQWSDGDEISLCLPMHSRMEPLPDGPELAALMYGPLVMVALADEEVRVPNGQNDIATWLEPNQIRYHVPGMGEEVAWRTPRLVAHGLDRDWSLWPLYAVKEEPYTMYLRCS